VHTHSLLDRCAHGWGITSGKGGKNRHQGPLALKAARHKGPLALKPTKPRENTSERVVFIKTMQFINPDIDYQQAAAAYDDYFTPLKERARFERQKAGHRPPRPPPRPHGAARPAHAHPTGGPPMTARAPRPGESYRGARRNLIIREEKGVWSHKCQLAPRGVKPTRGFFFCAPIAQGAVWPVD
jgi:hypothetical protein